MNARTYRVGDQVWVSLGFGDVRAVATVAIAKMITVETKRKGQSTGHFVTEQQLFCTLTLPRATKETKLKIMAKDVTLMCAVENRMDIQQTFVEGGKTDANS